MTTEIEEQENKTFEVNDNFSAPPHDIIAYNELRSCADLLRMHKEEILEIRPHFQREVVWQPPARTRFLDSLVKQLPIPSMCFSLDYRTQKWQVIDGLQRMWTIIQFLGGEKWRLSNLSDIDPSLSGRDASEFLESKSKPDSDLRQYYLRVENTALPITVIRCDGSNAEHIEYLFTIFHRLNTGAVTLNNQEIRNCIFSGSFNEFLQERDANEKWGSVTSNSRVSRRRYRGQEIVLRFFAFRDCYEEYGGGLSKFLNAYMMDHRREDARSLDDRRKIFDRTIDIVADSIISELPPGRIAVSILEALLVGVSLNLDAIENLQPDDVLEMYNRLLATEEFSEARLSEGLSMPDRVQGRISTAKRIFSGN